MKRITLLLSAVLAISFSACQQENLDTIEREGTILFDLEGLSLDEDTDLKKASHKNEVSFRLTINDLEYQLREGQALKLPVDSYHLSKFDIYVNDVLIYMLGNAIDFEPFSNKISVVQIPIFRVDDTENTYGKGEMEILESAYNFIKNGWASHKLYYTAENGKNMLDASGIPYSAAEGYPTIRLFNGNSRKSVKFTYQKNSSGEIFTQQVGPNLQLCVALPGGEGAAGLWTISTNEFKKTIKII